MSANISIFIPHEGCPQQCSFCNQKVISGTVSVPTPDQVDKLCEKALSYEKLDPKNTLIAFFGGSFTAIDKSYMVALLEIASKHVSLGKAAGIRVSTRPDCIDAEVLQLLKKYGVTHVELGAQSTDDEVLLKNRRGHTAEDIRAASDMILAGGFVLGLQMMLGLPGSNEEKERKTSEDFVSLGTSEVRIYPTLVMPGTQLSEWYEKGSYLPLTLDEAVVRTAGILRYFIGEKITVLRVGLHPDEQMREQYLAGPYHPAFRELCEGEIYFEILKESTAGIPKGDYRVLTALGEMSKVLGHKRKNVARMDALGYNIKGGESSVLSPYEIELVKEV